MARSFTALCTIALTSSTRAKITSNISKQQVYKLLGSGVGAAVVVAVLMVVALVEMMLVVVAAMAVVVTEVVIVIVALIVTQLPTANLQHRAEYWVWTFALQC